MEILYGDWSSGWLPSGAQVARKIRGMIYYTISESTTSYTVTINKVGVNLDHTVSANVGVITLAFSDGTATKTDSDGVSFTYKTGQSADSEYFNQFADFGQGTDNIYTKTINKTTQQQSWSCTLAIAKGNKLGANTPNTVLALTIPALAIPSISDITSYRVGASASGTNPSVDNASARGFFRAKFSLGTGYTVSASIKFGSTTAVTASIDNTNGVIYGYSASTACPTGAKTAITVTLTYTKGSTSITETVYDYIYPQRPLLDFYKTGTGKYNVGIGCTAESGSNVGPYVDLGNTADTVSVRINGNNLADYIIETGVSSTGLWTYEKWASGKLVQYARAEYTGKLSASQAGGYASASLAIENYPITFISNPVLTYGVYTSSDSTAFVSVYPSATPTTGIGYYRLWRANSQGTSYTYNVCFEAKGRWK